ncbi:hypothetical protein CEXT_676141 [Caerostris extrusa]|uniref:Uncharacterized protein n=1 Tax=Caerostris extrusa TaxID=172846 RepID=A0AAV4WQJ2_CAEEX|nr:hypothetical protein CEXT_676141 [Caerostris extrusa]
MTPGFRSIKRRKEGGVGEEMGKWNRKTELPPKRERLVVSHLMLLCLRFLFPLNRLFGGRERVVARFALSSAFPRWEIDTAILFL